MANLEERNIIEENDSEVNQKLGGGFNLINLVLLLLLVIAVGGSGFLTFDKGQMVAKTSEMDTKISGLKMQIDGLKADKVEVSKNAAEALAEIEASELVWSDVIQKVDALVPSDIAGRPKLNILSYSGATDGRLSLSMITEPALVPPYADVSQLLATYNRDLFFKDAYIPSIGKSINENSETTLSFIFNLTYEEPDVGGSAAVENTELDANEVKVPVNRTPTAPSEEAASETETPRVPVNTNGNI
ncbi:MAG: hypothetical protein ACRCZE_03575 [Candidatus Altimarinota bacterium]